MKIFLLIYMLLLFIVHQDFWLKDDASLFLGILPVGLAYHMGFTALAALGWFLVVTFAWPKEEDESES